jgi:glycerate-2-kinase
MSSNAIATVVKMMESLPENMQDQVVEHLREYLDELRSEQQWDETFKKTQNKLVAAAQLAKKQIAEGQARPMDYEQL